MAARDNVIFYANVASGTAADTVVPLSLLYGVENVRQGYGTPKLKNVRAVHTGFYAGSSAIPVEIKNSNWIDSAGLISQTWGDLTLLDRRSYNFMKGRDKVLAQNTSWTVNAIMPALTTAAGGIYVIFEIEYSDVPGIATEGLSGSPVLKTCTNASVTGAGNTVIPLGSFDNLLQGVTYVLSEAALITTITSAAPKFLVIEGFSNQKGLIRIIPVKDGGIADPIDGSVYLNKQTYNLGLIAGANASATPVTVYLEMIANQN